MKSTFGDVLCLQLGRHADSKTTLVYYTKVNRHDLSLVERIPDPACLTLEAVAPVKMAPGTAGSAFPKAFPKAAIQKKQLISIDTAVPKVVARPL